MVGVLEKIAENNLEKDLKIKLMKIINNTYLYESKNLTKLNYNRYRMIAVCVFVYLHVPERTKNIFNIVSIWAKIYP